MKKKRILMGKKTEFLTFPRAFFIIIVAKFIVETPTKVYFFYWRKPLIKRNIMGKNEPEGEELQLVGTRTFFLCNIMEKYDAIAGYHESNIFIMDTFQVNPKWQF